MEDGKKKRMKRDEEKNSREEEIDPMKEPFVNVAINGRESRNRSGSCNNFAGALARGRREPEREGAREMAE